MTQVQLELMYRPGDTCKCGKPTIPEALTQDPLRLRCIECNFKIGLDWQRRLQELEKLSPYGKSGVTKP